MGAATWPVESTMSTPELEGLTSYLSGFCDEGVHGQAPGFTGPCDPYRYRTRCVVLVLVSLLALFGPSEGASNNHRPRHWPEPLWQARRDNILVLWNASSDIDGNAENLRCWDLLLRWAGRGRRRHFFMEHYPNT